MPNLIGFDKNRENVEFKGHSKLSINFMSNYLFVEPENEEFKLISASFQWKFVMKKNLLFVFADFNFLDFCLEFKNEQICQKAFDYIYSGNKVTRPNNEFLIRTSFIQPIIQAISNNPPLNSSLIETIVKWHRLLDEEDKEKYTNLMKDFNIYDKILAMPLNNAEDNECVLGRRKRISRKRKFAEIKTEKTLENEVEQKANIALTKSIPSSKFQVMHTQTSFQRKLIVFTSDEKDSFHQFKSNLRNDKFQCITCERKAIIDVDENEKFCVKTKPEKHLCETLNEVPENHKTIKLIRKPAYEIFENCSRYSRRHVIVFDSPDRSLCHEYSSSHSTFYCLECLSGRKNNGQTRLEKWENSKASIFNEGTLKEYVEIINNDHECGKRKFRPEKYRQYFNYILKPNFEIQKYHINGKKREKLITFNLSDKNRCYHYFYGSRNEKFYCGECQKKGKYVSATLSRNSQNEEYVVLSNVKHVCEMKPYTPKVILRQHVDFELWKKQRMEV